MKIIVCIKQVAFICHPIAIDRKGGDIDREKVVYMLNPYDEAAVEEAIRIKERAVDAEIILLTLGPPRAEEALRYAFSMGADSMIRIDGDIADPFTVSFILKSVIKKMGFDIILCGKKAIDSNDCMVGTFLAESLNIAHVAGILKLDVFPEEKLALAERTLGRGDREVVDCSLPALFSVELGINSPRYPTLPNRFKADKKKIEVIEMSSIDVGLSKNTGLGRLTNLSPPRPRPKKIFTPDSSLSAAERRRLMMSGGKTTKKGDLIEGEPDKVAETILNVLIQEKIV
jgi:electron transfer flavoprotein beta subunit